MFKRVPKERKSILAHRIRISAILLWEIIIFLAHYSLFIIKKGHYSLIIIPHPDPHDILPRTSSNAIMSICILACSGTSGRLFKNK